jgi:hypothetical protein
MRNLSVLLICVLGGGFVLLDAHAQEPTAGVIFFQLREFNIPFKNDANNTNVGSTSRATRAAAGS